MSARGSRLSVVRLPVRLDESTPRFVRLSQLRKLGECEQVAAVCYRVRDGGVVEFLLIQTRGGERWTFPKGSAEPGLTQAQAAALEAYEEAGVHGRIEDVSFTRYVRGKGGNKRNQVSKQVSKPSDREVTVDAYLCEVLMLSPPPERKRNRTWFSVEKARQRLREGRNRYDAAEFARVVDRAVARIQQLQDRSGVIAGRPQRDRQEVQPRAEALQKDALQKVPFEFMEGYGRAVGARFMPYIRSQLRGVRQSAAVVVEPHLREVVHGEVLPFSSLRGKKIRALGSGANPRA
jgi:8-oxo-dGTP pyrophosphatase MutT (NUDIX family)